LFRRILILTFSPEEKEQVAMPAWRGTRGMHPSSGGFLGGGGELPRWN
jgi:hypothetical protein